VRPRLTFFYLPAVVCVAQLGPKRAMDLRNLLLYFVGYNEGKLYLLVREEKTP
jgi:hypothetical protein